MPQRKVGNMSLNLSELEQKASQLSVDERAQFALFLLETLEPTDASNTEEAWRIEAESRLAEIERGDARLVSAEDVFKNLSQRLT
jgi:putative addiction module component (TIGR02574 family)